MTDMVQLIQFLTVELVKELCESGSNCILRLTGGDEGRWGGDLIKKGVEDMK